VWFSDVGGFVGFVEPAAAAGSVMLAAPLVSAPAVNCFYLDEAPGAQSASQATGAVNYAAANWVSAQSIPGVTRYELPAAGVIAARPYGITISGGRTWVVDQDRLALSRLPRLPQAPKPGIRLVSGGVEVSWQAVKKDEGGDPAQVSAYRVWRSAAPYFSGWSGGLTLAAQTAATSAIDPVTLAPGSPLFYGVRSVASTGLLSATSAQAGAFSYGLVKGGTQ
jgi:hypothetical protein